MSTEANIALMIYSVYRANLGGDDAAIAVRNEFPSVVELLKPRLGNLAGVMDYCRKSPILARIVNDEDFAEFAGDFVDEILNPTPDDVEDEPQQARGAAAGAGPVPISGADETPSIS